MEFLLVRVAEGRVGDERTGPPHRPETGNEFRPIRGPGRVCGYDDHRELGISGPVVDEDDHLEMSLGIGSDDEMPVQRVLGEDRPSEALLHFGIDDGRRHHLTQGLGTGPANDRGHGVEIGRCCMPHFHTNEPTPRIGPGPRISPNGVEGSGCRCR